MTQNGCRHDVVVGRCDGGQILYSKHAGVALKLESDSYYTLRLHMFPGVIYFLSKNQGEAPTYTIFSKMVNPEGHIRFQSPVGSASLRPDLKTHLELRLNLFDRRLYMNLFPAD